jgi:hypothetical protein
MSRTEPWEQVIRREYSVFSSALHKTEYHPFSRGVEIVEVIARLKLL